MLPSKSHFNQLPARYGCYVVRSISSTFEDGLDAPKGPPVPLNAPLTPGWTLKGWVTYWIERQVTICPQVPPKGSPVPLNVPLSPGLTLKGWVTYWIERQVTICPQVPPKGSPVPLNVPLSPGLTLKGWVTYWIERQVTICPQVPPKGSPVPLNVPLSTGLTLKGWATYWIERQVTICPQVPPKGSPVPLHVPLSPGLTLKGWVPHWKFCGSGANVTPFGSGANVTLFQGRMWPPSLPSPSLCTSHTHLSHWSKCHHWCLLESLKCLPEWRNICWNCPMCVWFDAHICWLFISFHSSCIMHGGKVRPAQLCWFTFRPPLYTHCNEGQQMYAELQIEKVFVRMAVMFHHFPMKNATIFWRTVLQPTTT